MGLKDISIETYLTSSVPWMVWDTATVPQKFMSMYRIYTYIDPAKTPQLIGKYASPACLLWMDIYSGFRWHWHPKITFVDRWS